MGPVHLVWQDVVVLVTIMFMALLPPRASFSLAYFPVVFLTAYCATLAIPFLQLALIWVLVAQLLVAACGILFYESPLALLLIAMAGYGITYLGIVQSLREFPYAEKERESLRLVAFEVQSSSVVPLPILPADDLRGDALLFQQGRRYAMLLAGAGGILMFSFAFNCREEPGFERGLIIIHRIIAALAIFGRMLIYVIGHLPPISLLGRIATRRYIIPGYDVIFLAPLLAGLVAYFGPMYLLWLGIAPEFAVPLTTTVTLWMLLALPPDLETWRYTGHFRIPLVSGVNKELIRA